MSLGSRLNRVLNRMLMYQEAGAIDYSKDKISRGEGGHGAHGERRTPYLPETPLVVQWSERFERAIFEAEQAADAYERGVVEPPRRVTTVQLKAHIRDYAGRDPVYVAYHEGCSVELVRKVRRELGLHMLTGLTLERNERPLTAPTRDTLATIEEGE